MRHAVVGNYYMPFDIRAGDMPGSGTTYNVMRGRRMQGIRFRLVQGGFMRGARRACRAVCQRQSSR